MKVFGRYSTCMQWWELCGVEGCTKLPAESFIIRFPAVAVLSFLLFYCCCCYYYCYIIIIIIIIIINIIIVVIITGTTRTM